MCQQREVELRRIGDVTQFTISSAVELLTLVTSDDIVEKVINIDHNIHVVKPLWSLFGQFPN